eukprot:PhF_6_TR43373/c1_g1_i1/m.66511
MAQTTRRVIVRGLLQKGGGASADALRVHLLSSLSTYGTIETWEIIESDVTVQYQRLSSAEGLLQETRESKLLYDCVAPIDCTSRPTLFIFGTSLPLVIPILSAQINLIDPSAKLHVLQGSNTLRDHDEHLHVALRRLLPGGSSMFFGYITMSSIAKAALLLQTNQHAWSTTDGIRAGCMFTENIEDITGRCVNVLSILREGDLRIGLETRAFVCQESGMVDIGYYRQQQGGATSGLQHMLVKVTGGSSTAMLPHQSIIVCIASVEPALTCTFVKLFSVVVPPPSAIVTSTNPTTTAPSAATLESIIKSKLKNIKAATSLRVQYETSSVFAINQIVENCLVRSIGGNDIDVVPSDPSVCHTTIRIHKYDLINRGGGSLSIPWNKQYVVQEHVTVRVLCRVGELEYLGTMKETTSPPPPPPPLPANSATSDNMIGVVIGDHHTMGAFLVDVGVGHREALPAVMPYQSVWDVFPAMEKGNLEVLHQLVSVGKSVYVSVPKQSHVVVGGNKVSSTMGEGGGSGDMFVITNVEFASVVQRSQPQQQQPTQQSTSNTSLLTPLPLLHSKIVMPPGTKAKRVREEI